MATNNKPTSAPRRVMPRKLPPYRKLRGYAFDPSLSIQMATVGMNEMTFQVPWEDHLGKGPVGEYLEVVDADPASGCFYEPVDLNDPLIIAQDGLAISPDNPQFHQQMVYATAMTTIRNFEKALGRKALWRSRLVKTNDGYQDTYVQRLRIYPHALREANAYYSPVKRALLFGYFPAANKNPGRLMPGGTVFTCLSHDIIAHETTHALLDGMYGEYLSPTNLDTLAFHEAFADIVALFQHFTFPEVLRQQINRTRGDLRSQNLLGQLAQEMGVALGSYGSLRDAIGQFNPQTGVWEPTVPSPQDYQDRTEPHARGSILVAAVFDAFLTIYRDRITDLLRIATGGTGVLPAGDIHPDLVNRLANEAAAAARHVLHMCIRAMDYCPPIDMTFGDYLRAIVTADSDLVADDERGYRVAFIEAFLKRGIYPRDVRNLSIESLRLPLMLTEEPVTTTLARRLRRDANLLNFFRSRNELFNETAKLRAAVHEIIRYSVNDQPEFESMTGLVLQPGKDLPGLRVDSDGLPIFDVHSLQPAQRVGPDGSLLRQLIISINQTRVVPFFPDVEGSQVFFFRGGCTLILDLDTLALRYRIVRSITDDDRLAREKEFLTNNEAGSLRETYFNNSANQEPFAMLHREY